MLSLRSESTRISIGPKGDASSTHVWANMSDLAISLLLQAAPVVLNKQLLLIAALSKEFLLIAALSNEFVLKAAPSNKEFLLIAALSINRFFLWQLSGRSFL